MDAPPYRFPENFQWGSATASTQIEARGASDWGSFEAEVEAEGRVASDGPGRPRPGNISGFTDWPAEVRLKKTDFESFYAADFAEAAAEGQNACRLSVSWSRLFPRAEMVEPDPAGVAFYDQVFSAIEDAKLQPMVTLFHFESPAWLWEPVEGKAGWERADALEAFDRFVSAVVHRWGGRVHRWVTLNEPMVYLYNGYLQGIFPPLERRAGPSELGLMTESLLRAHARAYHRIHEDADARHQLVEVGIATHARSFLPYRNHAPLDRITADRVEQAFIWDFLDAVRTGELRLTNTSIRHPIADLAGTQDFVGINYYGRNYLNTNILHPTRFQVMASDPTDPLEIVSDLGWASDPRGLYEILVAAHKRYSLPMYITENGLADASDRRRPAFLVQHLRAVWDAIHHGGVEVKGYYHWSLTDNFEWAEGFGPRFGLWEVDYRNGFRRFPRPSAFLFGTIAKANAIPASAWDGYGRWSP